MLKITRQYTNFNGVEVTKDFYFNLTEAELIEMEMGTAGGLAEKLQALINAKQAPEVVKTFKEILLKAYGEKSDDGERFDKSDEIAQRFAATQVYSDLFTLFSTNAQEAAKFINGIVPKQRQLSENQLSELAKKQ